MARDGQAHPAQTAVHPGQVAQIAAHDRRVVERSVEQLVPVGHAAHRARVGVAAASRPTGADGPTVAAMTRIVVAGEALIDRMVRAGRRGRRDARRRAVQLGARDGPARGGRRVPRPAVHRRGRTAAARRVDRRRRDPRPRRCRPTTARRRRSRRIDAGGTASYRFDLDGTSAAGLTWPDLAATGLDPAAIEVLHVGTLGLLLEPSGTTIEALVEAVRPDALVFLDPNARPSATADPTTYRARIDRLAARADVVKVSTDDLRFLDARRRRRGRAGSGCSRRDRRSCS